MTRTPIVIADDHVVLREGLRALINNQPDLVVVGEAATGAEAVARVRETNPRVLCLDLSMPGWGGVTTIQKVREASARARVLVYTMHDDLAYVRSAVAAGAHGFILKTTSPGELLKAVRAVANGQTAFDSTFPTGLDVIPAAVPADVLSRREREVLELLALGHTHQEIADRLFVSVKTIETYRARLREKTGLKTRADLVRFGLETGLLANKDVPPAAED